MKAGFATGKYTAAAIRARPRERSVMVSQLLLGEPVRISESVGKFHKVVRAEDGLEGFVRIDQLLPVSQQVFTHQTEAPAFALELFASMMSDRFGMPVTFGARLPAYDGIQARHGEERFVYSGQAVLSADLRPDAELMIRLARKWLHVPELSGGRTPTGIAGSALVQLLTRMVGVRLPYSIEDISRQGRPVDFMVQCQEGDLAFFGDDRGRITHLGILLTGGTVLHVSERVRIDGIDHFGIFNHTYRRYTHRLRVVKRFFPDRSDHGLSLEKRQSEVVRDAKQMFIF
ncbi:cell wall-associated NlpC family hydrolase [Lewinella aquimaris]|uniref:Cell wall-associated NlpC family hydrolase n=1 Tax=Neolewinella aquimaris TaxID=1835722 RepID=A0A840E1K8_9BACT|nr:NlpC/P60 family protein [Neolewinella aquimaris]MBB4077843.1 cell wall-associated NlpC family hydrolase [Neolewinella aquimaris]